MSKLRQLVGISVLALWAAGVQPMPGAFAFGSGPSPEEQFAKAVKAVEKGAYRRAIRLLDAVLLEQSGNADALNYMGFSYRKLGDYKNAVAYYEAALRENPDHRGANEYLGEAWLELGKPDKAKVNLDRLARICGAACEEYRELKEMFEKHIKGRARRGS